MDALTHSPIALFAVQAVLIVVSSRLIGLLAKRADQPMVIAEVVAGILLGPSLLGWLLPGVSAALFPKASLAALGLVAQIGLALFMFLVGLELDPKLLRGRGHASVVISHSSILAPFALGALLALYLYPRLADPGVRFSAFTLFMGSAMSITAFPVLARILGERRLLRSKIGALAITCAAVDDVTAWCILAFVVAVVRTTGVLAALKTTLLAVGYILLMLKGIQPLLRRLGARSSTREGLTQNTVALTLVLLFLSSLATELIGIHALFGAFLLGAIIPKEGGFATTLAEKLEDLVVVLLLPMFFAYSGLRTQIGLLNTAESWLMCALIIAVACLGKFGGSTFAARAVGLSWREASAIGILMNTRGLMELVVLNIGLDLGVISPKLFAMMVIMALVTTFITTPLLSWVYPPTELAKELAEEAVETVAPAPQPAFTVLMCVSLDRSGPGMVTVAGALCGRDPGRLYALRLLRASDRSSFQLQQSPTPPADGLAPLLGRARELGLAVRPLSFVSAHPGRDIVDVASVKQADLIVLGWHKPLLSGNALGGTVREVMRDASADVGVLVDRGLERIGRVLVPYLGAPHDHAALLLAQRLHRGGAELTILHVVSAARSGSARQSQGRASIEEIFRGDSDAPAESESLRITIKAAEGTTPAEAALAEAAHGYDLMIVGVGPEWGLSQRSLRTHSEQIIQSCPTSLLVVKGRSSVRSSSTSSSPPSHATPASTPPSRATPDGAATA